jgi:hypothetical protein
MVLGHIPPYIRNWDMGWGLFSWCWVTNAVQVRSHIHMVLGHIFMVLGHILMVLGHNLMVLGHILMVLGGKLNRKSSV